MKIILSHATGNANVRQAAKAFAEAGMLDSFYTAVASFSGGILDSIGEIPAFSEIRRRRFDPIIKPYTKMHPWYEVGRLAATKFGIRQLKKHETGIFSIDAVFRNLDKHVAEMLPYRQRLGVTGMYAYEDGAKFSFAKAKQAGIECFYDLPTGYWRAARRLLAGEQERRPEWMPTMTGFKDSAAKLESKDAELCFADKIFVASQFTASTLKDYPGRLPYVKVIPYGFPAVDITSARCGSNGRLKLLFIGKLSQQKGIADLFDAVEKLKEFISLTVVGHKVCEDFPSLDTELAKHRWIPSLPHHEILKIMREHDILVFPSLFDGFGLAITEAMSQGTPVIASERCAGPDLIQHGENGWLFKAGSVDSLKAVIEDILYKPKTVSQAAKAALETARNRPWEKYRRELCEAVLATPSNK